MTWAPDYVTSSELKSYLKFSDADDDVFVALWITTVSRNVDDFCGRQFGVVAALETRQYDGVWDRHLGKYVYEIDDVQDVDDLAVVNASATVLTDYELQPVNAPQKGRPYERLVCCDAGPLTIDGLWGWTAVPSAVKMGLFLQANRLKARRNSPFGVAGSPEQGSEIRLLAQLDPDFRTSLKPYVRNWWAA